MTEPRRLTLSQQGLVNLLGAAAVSVHHDQGFVVRLQLIEQILPDARADVPEAFRPVIEAAEETLAAWPAYGKRGDGNAWCQAMLTLNATLARFFDRRALAALAAHEAATTPQLSTAMETPDA